MSINAKDNGLSIDDNFKDRTFEKFYQIDHHDKGSSAGSYYTFAGVSDKKEGHEVYIAGNGTERKILNLVLPKGPIFIYPSRLQSVI